MFYKLEHIYYRVGYMGYIRYVSCLLFYHKFNMQYWRSNINLRWQPKALNEWSSFIPRRKSAKFINQYFLSLFQLFLYWEYKVMETMGCSESEYWLERYWQRYFIWDWLCMYGMERKWKASYSDGFWFTFYPKPNILHLVG